MTATLELDAAGAQGASGPPRAGASSGSPTVATRPRRARRTDAGERWLGVAHLAPALVAAVSTLRWFRPGTFIAAGDVAPFIRDGVASELWSSWNHQLSGAGSPSFEVARLLDVAVIRAVGLLGGSDLLAQRIWYAGLLAAAALGAAYLAGGLARRPGAIAAAGFVGAFNPLVMVLLPNPLPMVTIAVAGCLGGLVLRAAAGRPARVSAFVFASLGVSYLAVNPPLLALVALWVPATALVASPLLGPGATRRALGYLGRAAPLAVVVNLWWIVPMVQTLFGGGGTLTISPEDNVDRWSWSHVDNTLVNVLTLKAHWGWRHPEYYPYAHDLDRGAWPWLRLVLPLGAASAPLLARGRARRAAFVLAGAAAGGIVVGKGLHAPLGVVNRSLYLHVPGFWLLREPMSKVGPFLVLVYGALIALALTAAADRLRAWSWRRELAGRVALLAALVAVLVAPVPMWTGAVIPDARGPLPSAHVAVPDAWRQLAARLDGSRATGKVLLLPLQPYYQVETNWGYHGTDTLVRQLVRRPVLQRLPGGYYGNAAGVDGLMAGVENSLQIGDVASARRLLQALGVSDIVVRRDVVTDGSGRDTARPDRLADGLALLHDVRLLGRYGVADVYELADADPVRPLAEIAAVAGDHAADAQVVSALGATEAVVPAGSGPVDSLLWRASDGDTSFELGQAGDYRLTRRLLGSGVYRTIVEPDAIGGPALVLSDGTVVAVDGEEQPTTPVLQVPLASGSPVAVEDGHGVQSLGADGALVQPTTGSTVRAWAVDETLPLAEPAPVGDCNAVDDRTPAELGMGMTRAGSVVTLRARDHTACTWLAVTADPKPGGLYRLRLDHRVESGSDARVCVWEDGPDRCAAVAPLTTADEPGGWAHSDLYVRPDAGARSLRVYLYADGHGNGGGDDTVVSYRSVAVDRLREVGAAVFSSPQRADGVVSLDAGRHTIAVTTPGLTARLGRFAELGDCNATAASRAGRGDLDLEIRPEASGDVVTLKARDGSACTSAPVISELPSAGTLHRVRLDYRTVRGRTARICVWQVGPNRCVSLPDLAPSTTWSTFDATFEPAPGTLALRLYVYADGNDGRLTVTQYRQASLTTPSPVVVVLNQDDVVTRTAPTTSVTSRSASRLAVDVSGADGRFLLAFADSFAPGWQLAGLPEGWTARHVEVDGYANGWEITGRGDAIIRLEYRPARLAAASVRLSAAALAAVAASALVGGLVRRRRSRRTTSR